MNQLVKLRTLVPIPLRHFARSNQSYETAAQAELRKQRAQAKKLREEQEMAYMKEFEAEKERILNKMSAEQRELRKYFDFKYDDQINQEVRVRFAPSPTGDLHIGGLRTALYNYLFAKANQGKFILRIEDTDKKREVEGAGEQIQKVLEWAGIKVDEGPGSEAEKNYLRNKQIDSNSKISEKMRMGPYPPYIQSQRLHIYAKFVKTLLENKNAYHCFCNSDRLKQMRLEQAGSKHAKTKYDRLCLGLSDEEVEERIANGEPYVIRMLIPGGETEFEDIVHGKITFNNDTVDDQVIMKSDGFPTYHFANVVDDYLMRITHVIRGEEWLPSTPKHVLLYKMFEMDLPKFAHLPLLLNSKGQKLSKRHGDVSVIDYKNKGYLPQALLNGLALLGWNPPHREDPNVLAEDLEQFLKHEVMTMNDLETLFDINKIGKSGVKFDERKLEYLNQMHIRYEFQYFNDTQERDECVRKWRKVMLEHLPEHLHRRVRSLSDSKTLKVMDMMKSRIHFYTDLNNHTYFFEKPQYATQRAEKFLTRLKQPTEVKIEILSDLVQIFTSMQSSLADRSKDFVDAASVNKACSMYLYENESRGWKSEDVFFLLRFALSGNPVGAPTGEISEVIGMNEVIERCGETIQFLETLR